jgi:hypothetical protein
VVVALTLAVMSSSCGKDSAPTAPKSLDQAPPAAPTHLAQATSETGDASLLNWTPSTSPNVAGYEVYRYLPDPTREIAYVLVQTTDANTLSYALPAVTRNPIDYYRIKSITSTGTRSDWSPMAQVISTLNPNGGDPDDGDGPQVKIPGKGN